MPRLFILLALPLLLTLAAATGSAAQPILHDAEIHPLGAASDLGSAFTALRERVGGTAWAGYTVPMIASHRTLCCGAGRCSLERRHGTFVHGDTGAVSHTLQVMLRIEGHRLTDIRAFSDGCHLDAAGLPVYLWEGVEAAQSLELLIARASAGRDVAQEALSAIAYHGTGEADRILERIARGELLSQVSEEAIFWLGEARGAAGFETLERLRHDLSGVELREQIAFALHLSEAPGALPALIEMARDDENGEVRSKALFWLAQEAGDRATAAIAEAGERDPDLEVKESAIFALSQLPPKRGVPLLIRYAENHPQGEIRKKAMFWLGQSEDPRALEFFEEVLTR